MFQYVYISWKSLYSHIYIYIYIYIYMFKATKYDRVGLE